jgi:deoxyribose-phosphate aldolase
MLEGYQMLDKKSLARLIDHTLLRADATRDDIRRLCQEAKKFDFWSVCVNPTYVRLATEVLKRTGVKVCSVVGFPLGASVSKVKAFEAENAVIDGAREIDMVINIGALRSRDHELVRRDIQEVVDRVKGLEKSTVVKAIIEASLLTRNEKVLACKLVKEAGADFVKTSTGFNGSGATVDDVRLMRTVVGPNFGVKAAGGIKTYLDAMTLIKAGANRIGTSSGVQIVGEK